jgi:hypothetical protein
VNYFFLRFLPYLYYFIREQYRLDNTTEPPTRRKRYFYRTIITILIFTLGLTTTVGVVKYRDLYRTHQATLKELKTTKEARAPNDRTVSRDRYEDDMHVLSMEKFAWENDARLELSELQRICKERPEACDAQTHHIIEDFQRKHP